MEISNEIFKKNLLIASETSRNFIIDQTNVVLYSRIEKLQLFDSFRKEAVVLVLSEQEQKKRMIKKERFLSKNSFIYPKLCLESFRNLQENFILPDGEGFDNISYAELNEEKSRKLVCLYNSIAAKQIHPLLREKKYAFIKNMQEKSLNDKNKILFEDNNSKFNRYEIIDEKAFNDLIELEKESMEDIKILIEDTKNPVFPTMVQPLTGVVNMQKMMIQEKNIVQQPQMLYAKNYRKPMNDNRGQQNYPMGGRGQQGGGYYKNNNNNNNFSYMQKNNNMHMQNNGNRQGYRNNNNNNSANYRNFNHNNNNGNYNNNNNRQQNFKNNQFNSNNNINNSNNAGNRQNMNNNYQKLSMQNQNNTQLNKPPQIPLNFNQSQQNNAIKPSNNFPNLHSALTQSLNNSNNNSNTMNRIPANYPYNYNVNNSNNDKPNVITNYGNYNYQPTPQQQQINNFPLQYMNSNTGQQGGYNYMNNTQQQQHNNNNNNNNNNNANNNLQMGMQDFSKGSMIQQNPIKNTVSNNNNINQVGYPSSINNNNALENANQWINVSVLSFYIYIYIYYM